MRRPLRLFVLAVLAGFPLVLVLAADLAFVPAAERRVETRASAAAKAASVEAEIGTFPVIARALVTGEVASVDISWFGVAVGSIEATSLELRLDGVGLDRGELFGGNARIDGVESGEVRMLISPSQLTRLFQREVTIQAGEVRVRLAPDKLINVEVSATNRGLVLTAAGLSPVSAELGADQIPCAPTAAVEGGNLVLSCSFRGLPPILRDRITSPG